MLVAQPGAVVVVHSAAELRHASRDASVARDPDLHRHDRLQQHVPAVRRGLVLPSTFSLSLYLSLSLSLSRAQLPHMRARLTDSVASVDG